MTDKLIASVYSPKAVINEVMHNIVQQLSQEILPRIRNEVVMQIKADEIANLVRGQLGVEILSRLKESQRGEG